MRQRFSAMSNTSHKIKIAFPLSYLTIKQPYQMTASNLWFKESSLFSKFIKGAILLKVFSFASAFMCFLNLKFSVSVHSQ